MKTLTLLRHAKSGWDDPVARDFDRPLNARGQRAAVLMGRYMKREGMTFDHIAASPAVRVTETLKGLASGYGARPSPAWNERFYLASAATLLDLIHELPDGAARALIVGHNPGLEELTLRLAADDGGPLRDEVAIKFPTASLAELRLDVDSWTAVDWGAATLVRFVRPRDLDPSLGPDGS
jgi:phosphohistidine phosphatase